MSAERGAGTSASPERLAEIEEELRRPGRGLLALRLGSSRFGLWLDEILEVLHTPPVSRLPLAEREVAGVTSVRGDIVPVLDLGIRLMDTPAKRPGRLVLVRHPRTEVVLGLLVDDVDALVQVREEEIGEAPTSAEATLPREMIAGVVAGDEGVVTILDLGRATRPPGQDSNEG